MTRDLSVPAGLPIGLETSSGVLTLGGTLRAAETGVRRLGDLRAVLAAPDPGPDDRPCYYLYRDVHAEADLPIFLRHGLRYDITVTLPGAVGEELMKTAGHDHSTIPGTAETYPEVYEVLAGTAIFLLQRLCQAAPGEAPRVDDVLLIGAGPGDVLLIPSRYGHVSINAGSDPLVVADLIARASRNAYAAFRAARGAAYYVRGARAGAAPEVWANPAYGRVPPPHWFAAPAEAGLGLRGPLYTAACAAPESFAFLTDPTLLPATRRA